MELSSEVNAGLKTLALCNHGDFNSIVDLAVKDLLHIAEGFQCLNTRCCNHSSSYSSLLAVFTELSKRQLSAQYLVGLLLDLDWPQDRIDVVSAAYSQVTQSVRGCLTSVASLLPHVVNVDWKLLHTVSGNPCTPPKESTYLVRFTVRTAPGGKLTSDTSISSSTSTSAAASASDETGLQHVTLRCSLPQLTAVTDSLRRALATVNKLAGTQ